MDRLFRGIGEEGSQRGPGAGQDTGDKADHAGAQHGPAAADDVAYRDRDLVELDADGTVLAVALDEEEHFGDGEQAHDCDQEDHAVHQVQVPEGQARHARGVVQPDHRDPQPDAGRQRRLGLVVRGDAAQRAERQQVQREIFGRAKAVGDAGQQRCQKHQAQRRQKRPDERRDARDHQRVAGAALFRHRVAVQRGHQRRFVARNVQQDRRDPPAIHRAVVDRRHQHQRRGGIQPHREGDGDQDRDPVRRTQAGQRADDGAQETADHREGQREPGQDRESDGEVCEDVHQGVP